MEISKRLPGRTDNAIKNRWNSFLRQHQRRDGNLPYSMATQQEHPPHAPTQSQTTPPAPAPIASVAPTSAAAVMCQSQTTPPAPAPIASVAQTSMPADVGSAATDMQAPTVAMTEVYGARALAHEVGGRVSVYWDGESRWFNGTVQDFSEEKGYLVLYDDGEEMWEEATTVEAGERTKTGKVKDPSSKTSKAKAAGVYMCRACGLPKKGHVCAVVDGGRLGSNQKQDAREETPPASAANDSDEAVRGKRDRRAVARYADDEFESPKPISRTSRASGKGEPQSKAQRRVWNDTAPSSSRGAPRSHRGREQDGVQEGVLMSERDLANDKHLHEWWRKYGASAGDNDVWWARIDMSKAWLAVRVSKCKKGGPRKREDGAGTPAEEEFEQEEREKNKLSTIRCLAPQELPLALPLEDYAPPHGFAEEEEAAAEACILMSSGCDADGGRGAGDGGCVVVGQGAVLRETKPNFPGIVELDRRNGVKRDLISCQKRPSCVQRETRPNFLELVELDLLDVSRSWLTPPPPTHASAAAAREAAAVARASAAAKANAAAKEDGGQGRATIVTPVSATVSIPVVYPEGWKEYATPQGRKYYHHAVQGVTQWDAPHGWPVARNEKDDATAATATVETAVAASDKHTEDAAGTSTERAQQTSNRAPSEANRTASQGHQAPQTQSCDSTVVGVVVEMDAESCVSSTNDTTTTTNCTTRTRTQGQTDLGQAALEMNANALEERESDRVRAREGGREGEREDLKWQAARVGPEEHALQQENGVDLNIPQLTRPCTNSCHEPRNGDDLNIPPLMDIYTPPEGFDVEMILADQLARPDTSRSLQECALVLATLIKSSAAKPFVDMGDWLRRFVMCATTTANDRKAIGPLDLESVLRKHRNTEHKGKFYKSAQQMREDVMRVLRLASQVYGQGHELWRCAAAVAAQFNETLAQRIVSPLHQGLTEAWTSSSDGTHWLGQRIRIYHSEDLSWHLATVDDCRIVRRSIQKDENPSQRVLGVRARGGARVEGGAGVGGEDYWEYHVVCDNGLEKWLELSIDVCIVGSSMTSSPFEEVEVVKVGAAVYCEFQEEWIGHEAGALQEVLNLHLFSLSLSPPPPPSHVLEAGGGWALEM